MCRLISLVLSMFLSVLLIIPDTAAAKSTTTAKSTTAANSAATGKSKPGPPKVTAASAILINSQTGKVLFAKNESTRRDPASLTKMMTAVLVLEQNIGSELSVVTARADREYMGASLNLTRGDHIQVADLLKGALIASANDSTVALAEQMTGNHDTFIELMNAKAFLLGLDKTNFENTNGFSKPNHYTTALDLARLAAFCLRNPDFARLVSTKQTEVKLTDRHGKLHVRRFNNTNRLLGSYPGTNGVKTGTTTRAGNCLVASVRRGNNQLISVVLKSRNRYEDTWKLMEFGFNSNGKN